MTMAAWDILQPHPFLRVAGHRGPHLALAEWNHSIFDLLILKYVAGSVDLVVVTLAVIFGYK